MDVGVGRRAKTSARLLYGPQVPVSDMYVFADESGLPA
jgi:hypothetical protein